MPFYFQPLFDAASQPGHPGPSRMASSNLALGRPIRVLVVDDHEDSAKALDWLLKRRGFEVRCAHTGSGALAVARQFLPEILLLDLGLPEIDGYEIARTLRAEAPFQKALFIAISGYAESGDRAKCLANGFDAHLAKPVEVLKLMEIFSSRLNPPIAPASSAPGSEVPQSKAP